MIIQRYSLQSTYGSWNRHQILIQELSKSGTDGDEDKLSFTQAQNIIKVLFRGFFGPSYC